MNTYVRPFHHFTSPLLLSITSLVYTLLMRFLFYTSIDPTLRWILGIAEVCAPQELLYWIKDLEGCSFGSTDALSVEDLIDEKDDPDLTWTSAVSTKG